MDPIREHPLSVFVALLAGLVLGAGAAAADWSTAALYGAMSALAAALVLGSIGLEQWRANRHH